MISQHLVKDCKENDRKCTSPQGQDGNDLIVLITIDHLITKNHGPFSTRLGALKNVPVQEWGKGGGGRRSQGKTLVVLRRVKQ